MSCLGLRLSICVLGITMPLLLAGSADAAAVQCGAGDVQCLIAAINDANARPQRKTIIQLAGGTYSLSDVDNLIDGPNGLPSIASTITIEAGPAGATITRDDNALPFRLLHVEPAGHLSLNGVSLVNGDSQIDTSTMSPLHGRGGALLNDRGGVKIVNCGFESNQAEDGGGVFTNLGTLTVSDTTFVNNTGMDTGVL